VRAFLPTLMMITLGSVAVTAIVVVLARHTWRRGKSLREP